MNRAAVLLVDPQTGEFSLRSQIGGFHEGFSLSRGNGIIGQAARKKRPLYVADVSKNLHYVANFADTKSELAIPLMVRDEVVGVLDFQSGVANYFDKDTIDLASDMPQSTARWLGVTGGLTLNGTILLGSDAGGRNGVLTLDDITKELAK